MSEDLRPRLIEVEIYGEGYKPVCKDYGKCLHGGEGSCISSSGNSICGGYEGVIDSHGKTWVICGENPPGVENT